MVRISLQLSFTCYLRLFPVINSELANDKFLASFNAIHRTKASCCVCRYISFLIFLIIYQNRRCEYFLLHCINLIETVYILDNWSRLDRNAVLLCRASVKQIQFCPSLRRILQTSMKEIPHHYKCCGKVFRSISRRRFWMKY